MIREWCRENLGVRPRCPQLPVPYSNHNLGKPGGAVSSRDSWGIWKGLGVPESRERAAYSFGHVNDVVSD